MNLFQQVNVKVSMVIVVLFAVLLVAAPVRANETDKTQSSVHPSDQLKKSPNSGNVLKLYEWADDKVLESEKKRLAKQREELKQSKKDIKKTLRLLKKQIKDAEKRQEDSPSDSHKTLNDEVEQARSDSNKARLKLDNVTKQYKRNRIQRKNSKNVLVTPFAAPSYTPEMGGLLAGGGLLSFKAGRRAPDLQRSSLTGMGGYSTTGAGMAFSNFTGFFAADLLRIVNENWFKSMPDNYWGAGYEAGAKYSSPNEHTEYHRIWWSSDTTALLRLGVNNLYGGMKFVFNQTVAEDVSATMAADPDYQKYGANNYNGGLGAAIVYDSRDVAINAWKGVYVKLSAVFFDKYMGGKNSYQVYNFDYRQYVSLGKHKGNTLAWQVKSRLGVGDVPWAELSHVGNPFDLRGYQWVKRRTKNGLSRLGSSQ